MVAAATGLALGINAGSATAQELNLYFEGFVGGPIPQDYEATLGGGFGEAEWDPDVGLMFGGAVGTYVTDAVRAEISYSYSWAEDGQVTLASGGAPIPHSGSVNVHTLMASGFYEFYLGDDGGPFTPWVGAGLGLTIYDYDNLGATGGAFVYDGSDTAFTGALHAGFDIALSDRIDLTGRYSLAFIDGHDVGSTPAGVPLSADSVVENVFLIGLRFGIF
jgi:outer membrane protein W